MSVSSVIEESRSNLDIKYSLKDEIFGAPFLPFGLEKKRRSNHLPSFLPSLIAPFCCNGVLSEDCCTALGNLSKNADIQAAVKRITSDIKGNGLCFMFWRRGRTGTVYFLSVRLLLRKSYFRKI